MLDQFISKIQNVQKDLYTNFSLSPTSKKLNEPDESETKQSETSNQHSIELCNHYQSKWSELHRLMESNVNRINDGQRCLKQLIGLSDKQLQSQQDFNFTLKSLNEIENGLAELDHDLTSVQKSVETVEQLLTSYAKRKHLESLRKLEADSKADYEVGCQARSDEFDSYKVKLLDDHHKKAKEIEALQSVKFKQRSTLFQSNFEKEVQEFKRTGRLPASLQPSRQPVESANASNQTRSLEEIEISTDDQEALEKALDEFLNY